MDPLKLQERIAMTERLVAGKPISARDRDHTIALLEFDIVGDTAVFLCVDGWFKTLEEGNTVLRARQRWLFESNPTLAPPNLKRIYRLKLAPFVPQNFSIREWMGDRYRDLVR